MSMFPCKVCGAMMGMVGTTWYPCKCPQPERAMPATDPKEISTRIVHALFERGRKASSGEPLFFDERNMRLIVERELAALLARKEK